jgi:hypothetical protein
LDLISPYASTLIFWLEIAALEKEKPLHLLESKNRVGLIDFWESPYEDGIGHEQKSLFPVRIQPC